MIRILRRPSISAFVRSSALPQCTLNTWVFALIFMFLIPGIGVVRGGARSWIGFGSFSIQPAEFMKLGILIIGLYILFSLGTFFYGIHLVSYMNPNEIDVVAAYRYLSLESIAFMIGIIYCYVNVVFLVVDMFFVDLYYYLLFFVFHL